jgi:hypothetical protein
MATSSVACVGDVTATAGAGIPPTADAGIWTAGPVTLTSYDKLTVNGAKAVHQAQCTFSFNGTKGTTPPVTVTDSSTVTLTAAPTILEGSLSNVLRNGDSASDTFGNTVKATSARLLTSG